MTDVSQLLERAGSGDRQAARDLLPLVYEELRKLAAVQLAAERPGQTLQPTALVHEAYLRLVQSLPTVDTDKTFANRRHFYAAAALAMQHILIDQARRKKTVKHGAERTRLDLDQVEVAAAEAAPDVEALGQALDVLAQEEPQAAELVRLRWFAGLTMPQVADVLGLSLRSVERLWTFARTWLYARLQDPE